MFYYHNIYIYPYNYTKSFYINRIYNKLIKNNTQNCKNIKKVRFQYNCKKFDGTSQKNIIYFKLIINYLDGKIKNYRDILYFVRNKENIIYCLNEMKEAEENMCKSIFENLKSVEYKKPSISIIRTGSRDYSYRFFPEHIKKNRKLIKLLENSLYFY